MFNRLMGTVKNYAQVMHDSMEYFIAQTVGQNSNRQSIFPDDKSVGNNNDTDNTNSSDREFFEKAENLSKLKNKLSDNSDKATDKNTFSIAAAAITDGANTEVSSKNKTDNKQKNSPVKRNYKSIGIPENEKTKKYIALAEKYAEMYNIPTELIPLQIQQESNYDERAGSYAGAQGLMQLMPETARSLGCNDPWNPEANIKAGCKYLRQMYDMFGRWDLALAAYNAGPGAVQKYKGIPDYKETQNYVAIISKNFKTLTGKDLSKINKSFA